MKIAHLVLAHNDPAQLARLAASLFQPDADIYVHIDLKTPIEPFIKICEGKHIVFIKNRVKVTWGGFSIVEATVNSFSEILQTKIPYSHVNLLSGQDYPVQPIESFHNFLNSNTNISFMHTLRVYDEWQEAIPRLHRYHLTDFHFKGKHFAERIVNVLIPNRKFIKNIIPVGRSQWFTIALPHLQYIVNYINTNAQFVNFFKLTWAPDELFFQTILYNSEFREHMVNNNLRYIDWSAGGASPKVLTMEDYHAIEASGKYFARKFNPEKSRELLETLDRKIKTVGMQ
jgi:Core-2/I-Branching enzyme